MQDNIKITFYEPWMDSQIIELFCRQYGNSTEQFTQFFFDFYNHNYQKNESIRLVALSDKTVAGFASFCKWPYVISGKKVRSFQCGNVIISEDFRGKGLYNRMLNYLNEEHEALKIDLIIGFPIKEIVKLYLKSGWTNPFNVSWYVKPVNVFSLIMPVNKQRMESLFSVTPSHMLNKPGSKTELEKTEEFYKWHKAYNCIFDYYYFKLEKGNEFVEFSLKLNIRKKVIKELIIGEVITNSEDVDFVTEAFKTLRKKAFKTGFVTLLSIALNDWNKDSVVLKALQNLGYKKIEKDIKFIYKNFTVDETSVSRPENWVLYRRDLDTW